MDSMNFEPIGFIQSDFKEKFGVPRQSLMISEAKAVLKLKPNPSYLTALNHLESFSHVWIVFVFHKADDRPWTPTIRPPRIGAPNRVGVFASRSPHRPNPIGISAVRLEKIDLQANGGIEIHLSGIDLLDGTPVLDLKPYVPYADSIPDASSGWAEGEIPKYAVSYSSEARAFLDQQQATYPQLEGLLTQTLEYDPRPRGQREAMPIQDPLNEGREFRFRLMDFDIHWRIENGGVHVIGVIRLST